MDDGNILRSNTAKWLKDTLEPDVHVVHKDSKVKCKSKSPIPTSAVDQYKYYLSTRTSVPADFLKKKLLERLGHLDFDVESSVLVLSILVKRHIRKLVMAAKRDSPEFPAVAVRPRDLIELSLESNKRLKLGEF